MPGIDPPSGLVPCLAAYKYQLACMQPILYHKDMYHSLEHPCSWDRICQLQHLSKAMRMSGAPCARTRLRAHTVTYIGHSNIVEGRGYGVKAWAWSSAGLMPCGMACRERYRNNTHTGVLCHRFIAGGTHHESSAALSTRYNGSLIGASRWQPGALAKYRQKSFSLVEYALYMSLCTVRLLGAMWQSSRVHLMHVVARERVG
jgi:hypothetical protein